MTEDIRKLTTPETIETPLTPAIDTLADQDREGLVAVGTGEIPKDIIKTLTAKDVSDLDTKQGNRPIANRHIDVAVYEEGPARQIVYTHKNTDTTITIELEDIVPFKGNNQATKKALNFVFQKANEQAVNKDRELIKEYVAFSLNEVVESGMYKSVRAARRGMDQAFKEILQIKIHGSRRVKRNKTVETDTKGRVPVTGYDITNNLCIVYLNTHINWSLVIPYYAYLPKYYYSLSPTAADLLYYVFYLARMNAESIASTGKFTITLRSIQDALQLPNEEETIRHTQLIKGPLETAINEIMEKQQAHFNNTNFELELDCIEGAKINEYLDRGKIIVTFKGSFKEAYSDLAKLQASREQARKDKIERIDNQAQAIVKAKELIANKE